MHAIHDVKKMAHRVLLFGGGGRMSHGPPSTKRQQTRRGLSKLEDRHDPHHVDHVDLLSFFVVLMLSLSPLFLFLEDL